MKDFCKLSLACICLLMSCCSQNRKPSAISFSEQNASSVKDSVFLSPYGGYGYDIIVNGKVKIHQPHIPIVAGQLGFASAQDARRTAQLVITKIKRNQFPPQLTRIELENLGIVAPNSMSETVHSSMDM